MQVEFNKAAQSLTDVAMAAGQKKVALSRLINVSRQPCIYSFLPFSDRCWICLILIDVESIYRIM